MSYIFLKRFKFVKGRAICDVCRTLCVGCGIQLTHENIDNSAVKRKQYICKKCQAKGVRESRDPINQKDYDLQRTYGISFDEYNKVLEIQKGVCWICNSPPGKKSLSVDHEHQKGEKEIRKKNGVVLIRKKIRGLLCWFCNSALGKMKDNPSLLRRAAEYLEIKPAQEILK